MWRAVADPTAVHKLPTLSSLPDEPYAIWTAVLHLALYSFAWPSLAQGVGRWLDEGLPTDDRRLQVMAHLLGDDPAAAATELRRFLSDPESTGPQISLESAGLAALTGLPPRDATVQPVESRGWDGRGDNKTYLGGYKGGGSDPLHLSVHVWAPVQHRESTPGVPVSGSSRHGTLTTGLEGGRGTAVLMLDTYAGWYENLTAQCESLPELRGGRSWRVDVVVRPLGVVGRFRRSRETGLWFSGQHRYHQWGTP